MNISSAYTINKRTALLARLVVYAFFVIICRLAYLQIYQWDYLTNKSTKNFIRHEYTIPLRGSILDNHGTMLATNRPVNNVYWQGTGNNTLNEQQFLLIDTLHIITDTRIDINRIKRAERFNCRIPLFKDLSFSRLSQIAEACGHHKNIHLNTHFTRWYPYKSVASHVLGYIGNMNMGKEGQMGLEKIFETTLQGKNGHLFKITNSFGAHLNEHEIEHALSGNDIRLTIDLPMQRALEWLFPAEYAGACIIMNPQTGSIKALVSRPTFDPNIFSKIISYETWQEIQAKRPFVNRVFHACYPPGSIFKLVTISAALEHGIVDYDSLWNCKGFIKLAQRRYRCHRTGGHGLLTTKQAVAHSCNILFYEIGKKIDIDILAKHAHHFGLGIRTSSTFDDYAGLVPTRAWKERTRNERWWLGETLSTSIGQSFLLTTPIQIARMIGAIETGYLVTPRILETEPITCCPLSIKYETRLFLKKAMRSVITKGTGKRIGVFDNFTIYAKTSTAQTSTLYKRKLGQEYLEHGWFVCNFSYQQSSPLTMVILVENVGNAKLPILIARGFFKAYEEMQKKQRDRDT